MVEATTSPTSSDHHQHILSKALSLAKSHLVQIPSPSWTWLITQFPDFVPPSLSTTHDHFFLVPIQLLSSLLHKYDILLSGRPAPPRPTQFSTSPSHTWHKCWFAAPKIARLHGSIRSASGDICVTTHSLDQALRATRAFWSERPTPYQDEWSPLLADYSTTSLPLPPLCPHPGYTDFYHAAITSPDSAPGADGIAYSAWRVCPSATAHSLQDYFFDIIFRQASPPYNLLCLFLKLTKVITQIIIDPLAYLTLVIDFLIGPLTPSFALSWWERFILLKLS